MASALAAIGGYIVRKMLAEAKIASAEEAAKKLIADAIKEADSKKRETILEAKEDIHRLRTELDNEIKERRQEQQRVDKRLNQKEETLDRKLETVEKKDETLRLKETELGEMEQKIQELHQRQLHELERLSGLSQEEARELLLQNVKKETRHEAAQLIKEIENQTKQEAEKRAREIISQSIQRYAADHVAETTV
ncbi:MAG TPA: ribonuclease Y, partial [Firmicutes bacterium]|nr:ribonuclease Y [Bacillota bacterium]